MPSLNSSDIRAALTDMSGWVADAPAISKTASPGSKSRTARLSIFFNLNLDTIYSK